MGISLGNIIINEGIAALIIITAFVRFFPLFIFLVFIIQPPKDKVK